MDKKFKTLEEQIKILKDKGLVIKDEKYALDILMRENYFFLSGYKTLLYYSKNDRRFIEGTTFEEYYSVFLFDRNIRHILFKHLMVVENNIKSVISYQLSKNYGISEKDYLNPKNFSSDPIKSRQIGDLLRKMKRQIKANTKQHNATVHFLNNYGFVPLWVMVKVLSFGILSELYAVLKVDDKISIAEYFDIDSGNLEDYLPILANYRNLCAHEDILYNNRTQRMIADTKYHRELEIPMTNEEYIYGKNDILAVLIILKQMLLSDEFDEMIQELKDAIELLDRNVDTVSMKKVFDAMGIPENFHKLTGMENS